MKSHEDHYNSLSPEQQALDDEWGERIRQHVLDELARIREEHGIEAALFCTAGIHLYQHCTEVAFLIGPGLQLDMSNHILNTVMNGMIINSGGKLTHEAMRPLIEKMIKSIEAMQEQYSAAMVAVAPVPGANVTRH